MMKNEIDNAKFELMTEDFSGLINWASRRYGTVPIPITERKQAALIGFWHAVTSYDPSRGRQLSSWIVKLVCQELKKCIKEKYTRNTISLGDMVDQLLVDETTPEEIVIGHDESQRLLAIAKKVRRVNDRTNRNRSTTNTFTASDIARMMEAGKSQSAIARELGVSRQRIGQIVQEIRAERA